MKQSGFMLKFAVPQTPGRPKIIISHTAHYLKLENEWPFFNKNIVFRGDSPFFLHFQKTFEINMAFRLQFAVPEPLCTTPVNVTQIAIFQEKNHHFPLKNLHFQLNWQIGKFIGSYGYTAKGHQYQAAGGRPVFFFFW